MRMWPVVLVAVLLSPSLVLGDARQDAARAFDVAFAESLARKIKAFPKGTYVKVLYKDGTEKYMKLGGYKGYDDTVWLVPLKQRPWPFAPFFDEAVSIYALWDVRLAMPV